MVLFPGGNDILLIISSNTGIFLTLIPIISMARSLEKRIGAKTMRYHRHPSVRPDRFFRILAGVGGRKEGIVSISKGGLPHGIA